ncbi:MAG TPA: hypothetical protein VFV92_12500, partial [Candidatus Bathyarchaeia archaeon]|nr:hypothetical protein [Candidatus Bathyarchaeia archaeon]
EIDHNPFIFFKDITNNTSRCSKIVLANTSNCSVTDCAMINDLNSSSPPNFMWLTPNDCNNMHAWSGCTSNGCTSGGTTTCIKDGDNYLKSLVPSILNSQTFTSPNSRAALFITFDEGHSGNGPCPLNGSSEDCIYSIWAGPQAKSPFHSPNLYNHYSLTKTIEANWNLPKLTSNDGNATAMTKFFKQDFSITTSPSSVTFNSGSTDSFNISVSSLNGFTSNVNLSTSTSPSSGLSVSCNPTIITGGAGTSICTLEATIAGNYTVSAIGTSGNISHNDIVKVTVSISGTVGGEIKSVDKLRLVLLFLLPGILVLVSLVAAANILKRTKRRSL